MSHFFILHCLKAWGLPPGLNIALFIFGFILFFISRTIGRIFFLLGFITLWLFSAPIFSYNLIEVLQNKFPTLTLPTAVPAHAAIVVLGGGDSVSVEQGMQAIVSDETFNRLRYAAYLHQELHLPVIVSGGNANGAALTSAKLMSNTLKTSFNIPSTIEEDQSINTADESKLLKPILAKNHFDVIYLVTNAWHMPRSVYLFTREGIHVIPAPMGYEVYDHHYSLLSFLPDSKALSTTSIAIHEFIGIFVARYMSHHPSQEKQ